MSPAQGSKRERDESLEYRAAKVSRRLYEPAQRHTMESEGITDADIEEMFKIIGAIISAQSPNYKPSAAMAADLAKAAGLKGSETVTPTCSDIKDFPDPWIPYYVVTETEQILSQKLQDKLDGAVYADYCLRLNVRERQVEYWIDGLDNEQDKITTLEISTWVDFGADRVAKLKSGLMGAVLDTLQFQNTVRAKTYANLYFLGKRTGCKKVDEYQYRFYQLSDFFDKIPLFLAGFDDPPPEFLGHKAEKID